VAGIIFRSYRPEVEQAIKKAIDVGMEAVAQAAEANAISEVTTLVYDAPPSPTYVRTGDLRKSITHKYVQAEQTAYVGANIDYAPYVEFGTRKMASRPFLRNSVQKYTGEYAAILKDALSKL
jgi:HK97 gp10 family phage protein